MTLGVKEKTVLVFRRKKSTTDISPHFAHPLRYYSMLKETSSIEITHLAFDVAVVALEFPEN